MTIMDCTQDSFYGEEKKKDLIDDLIGVINKVFICYNWILNELDISKN